jgi:hypothetical protein
MAQAINGLGLLTGFQDTRTINKHKPMEPNRQYEIKGKLMSFNFKPLYATYPAAIKKMRSRFDSHAFIRVWSHYNQKCYIDALTEQNTKKGKNPFMIVHGNLAKGLTRHPKLVQQVKEIPSRDIFGEKTPCMSWRRV